MAKLSPELANELEFYRTNKNPEIFQLEIKPDYLNSFCGVGGLVLVLFFVIFGCATFLLHWFFPVCCFVMGFFLFSAIFSHKIIISNGFLIYEKYFVFKEKIPLMEIQKAKREYHAKRSEHLWIFPQKSAKWKKFGVYTNSFHWFDNRKLTTILENLTGQKV